MKNIKGFTLIELVVVIVILGILAATALPKFIDLKGDAANASAQAVAGALSSATSMNYAKFLISANAAVSISNGVTCSTLMSNSNLISTSPTGATVSGTLAGCTAGGVVSSCLLGVTGGSASQTAAVTCTN